MFHHKNTHSRRGLLGRLLWLILGLLLLGFAAPAMAQDIPSDDVFAQVYEEVSPSVVSISVIARRPGSGMVNEDQAVVGSGTGFVLDREGHIMTNNHVVDGATEIELSFFDGTLARAEIVGLDPDSDLAVLQAQLPQEDLDALRPIEFADSSELRIGQTVLAIGSPFGQRWTLTSGIISAIGRSIQGLSGFSIGGVIQTDAAINPGNSGGPLLDVQGRVIGVNSQIVSATRSSAGIGFAVPGNLARRVAEALITDGFVNYSYLGIGGIDMYLPLLEAFDLPNDTQGIVVTEVAPNGPVSQTSIEAITFEQTQMASDTQAIPIGVDIITAIEDEPLSGMSELIGYLAAETRPGQTVTLTVLRVDQNSSEEMQVQVELAERP